MLMVSGNDTYFISLNYRLEAGAELPGDEIPGMFSVIGAIAV